MRAFINLAYNIYLIAHHTEKDGDAIVKRYVDRLKGTRPDDFAGALFETYAAAAFLKAGFTLAFENESDGSVSHVEFVALYPRTGKRFSVEVKARERAAGASAAEDVDDVKRLRVANKLNKALGKKAEHTRVVMIEINLPDVVTSFEGWPAAAMEQFATTKRPISQAAKRSQAPMCLSPITLFTTISVSWMPGCSPSRRDFTFRISALTRGIRVTKASLRCALAIARCSLS